MNSTTISKNKLLHTAPSVLVDDAGLNPLTKVLADALSKLTADSLAPIIYTKIDELPEALLDILAEDYKVDWYDYNADLTTKRRLITDAFYVHRHLGTAGAVKRALTDIWPDTYVEEWFEYGGDPYTFRIVIPAEWTQEAEDAVRKSLMLYKNARSHVDTITFNYASVPVQIYIAAAECGVDIQDEAIMM